MSRKASVAQLIFIKVTKSKLQPAVIAGILRNFQNKYYQEHFCTAAFVK